MARVVERLSTVVEEGVLRHSEVPSSYIAAEALSGRRLDRRRSYAIIEGEVLELLTLSTGCPGCCDEAWLYADARGAGCDECGYTGRRRWGHWVPLQSLVADSSLD